MFKPATLRAYLLQAREAGYSPESVLEGTGISWSDVESLQPLELGTITSLFELLARRTPAGFAIANGAGCKVRDFGMVGFALMSMPTLREALEHWNRYALVAGHPVINTISEEGDRWRNHFFLRQDMSEEGARFCLEISMAALEPVMEELTGATPSTLKIDFAFDSPSSADQYAVFKTRNLHFGGSATVYHGKRSDLDRPIPSRDTEVREMFHRQCAKFLNDLTNARSICDRLGDLMRASAGNIPSLDEMAVTLRLSRRSLQRELKSEGMSYQQLVKEFRVRHAMLLLGENRANIKSIAFALGFKDVASFRRAFQAWTGQSIGEWLASPARSRSTARPAHMPVQHLLHVA